MPDSAARARAYLPWSAWPTIDRQAWEALFAEGDILDGAGPARHWRPATRRFNMQHYARWLGWLCRTERLDIGGHPVDRITPERVHAYAEDLVRRLAPRTVAMSLIGLKAVAKAAAPERDWRWLMDLTNRFHLWAKPSVDRRNAMQPIDKIFHIAKTELDRLQVKQFGRRTERIAYRDALMVLVLAACPIRLSNFTTLEIGHHVLRESDRWAIKLSERDTKNGQRLSYLLPRSIAPYLDAYLEVVRPGFEPHAACPRLWIGVSGKPLSYGSVAFRIISLTERLFGQPINPHLFRACAATSLVEEAPAAARLAAPLLGHRYFQTTERYYIRAGQISASRQVNAVLGAIVAGDE